MKVCTRMIRNWSTASRRRPSSPPPEVRSFDAEAVAARTSAGASARVNSSAAGPSAVRLSTPTATPRKPADLVRPGIKVVSESVDEGDRPIGSRATHLPPAAETPLLASTSTGEMLPVVDVALLLKARFTGHRACTRSRISRRWRTGPGKCIRATPTS